MFFYVVISQCLYAFTCRCPTNQLGAIREALRQGAEYSGTGAQPILTPLDTKMPPTYHVTNKFTGAFQVRITELISLSLSIAICLLWSFALCP